MICRSSAGCDDPAGFGTFGAFCADHARELQGIKAQWFSSTGRVRATPLAQRDDAPAAPEKLPVPVRAHRLAVAVRDRGRLTREEAATACGLETTTGSLSRVITYARERGWVRTLRGGTGGGLVAGDEMPPAEAA